MDHIYLHDPQMTPQIPIPSDSPSRLLENYTKA